MTDDTYKMSVHKIKDWVKAWAGPDNLLNHDMYNLIGDATSYCYMYWLEVNKKFEDDTEANKYYNATFLLKLSTYMNHFYKHKSATKEDSPQALVYADASDEEDKSLWDALDITYEEHKEPNIAVMNKIIQLFIDTTPSYNRDMMKDIVDEVLKAYEKRNKKITSLSKENRNNLTINYNLKGISEKYNKSQSNASSIFSTQKNKFAKDFPEILDYLESYNIEDIEDMFKETIVVTGNGAGRKFDRHERLQAYIEGRLTSVDTVIKGDKLWDSFSQVKKATI